MGRHRLDRVSIRMLPHPPRRPPPSRAAEPTWRDPRVQSKIAACMPIHSVVDGAALDRTDLGTDHLDGIR